ncbi:MAG: single-stranded-DNA-specific exonuclease RecJ, partial [candidate division WOR-3 bacterium]
MSALAPNHNWNLPEPDSTDGSDLAKATGLPRLIATLLQRRGFASAEAVRRFLEPSAASLHRPDTLPDIDRAVERIMQTVSRQQRILVYGDYDVDGITGTAILVSALRMIGADAITYLPQRETEGYGLSLKGLEYAQTQGCTLIVTTDCGITDLESTAAAATAGIEVVVTDHHEPRRNDDGSDELPTAVAIVNPKRSDSSYPFRELAGCGVAFKLAWRLLQAAGRTRQDLAELLDLAALGTIADMVPLLDENRIIARLGLKSLQTGWRPGIRALTEKAGLRPANLSSRDVSFVLAPRINAAGRVGNADTALRLLLTSDRTEADQLASQLDEMNRSRQLLEESIFEDAAAAVESSRLFEQRVMVVAGEGWHEGVIGIVASKLVERFYRPCVLVSFKGETGKGSGRSITGFDLYSALKACSDCLLRFGGHRYAAGLQIHRQQVARLAAELNAFAARLPETVFEPTLHVEAVARLSELDATLLEALAKLEPFGPDNPEPVFATLGLEVVGCPQAVGRDHLKFRVRDGDTVVPAIAWGRSSALNSLQIGRKNHLDICYTIGE